MPTLEHEISQITRSETVLYGPYPRKNPDTDPLRVVFFIPYGHAYSLLCTGPLALHDMINRRPDIPAVAERALLYDCLIRTGNRVTVPVGEVYRSIESPVPVRDADIIGVSITNPGDLHSVFKLFDLAGIPRRAADRNLDTHPLLIGGNGGFANPEVLADYLDVVALGEAEHSFVAAVHALHHHRRTAGDPTTLWERLAQIPGLYVPRLYDHDLAPGGGITAVRPRSPGVPVSVQAQYLQPADLHPAHFTSPITSGDSAACIPLKGCRHSCHFCTLGTPPFRQAPLEMLTDYIDLLEQHKVRKIIISAPTFTQYRWRGELLEHIRAYARRSPEPVTTIIGSVRADELSADYLSAVAELGDVGHLFTELRLNGRARGIITIAPEFASPDLVRIFNKTMHRARVETAIDLCRDNADFATIMLYFIVGVPGERRADRLAIADYARDVQARLGRPDGAVIVKLQQFMPEPGTVAQRLPMVDPVLVDGYVQEIRDRLADLVGADRYSQHFRVLWGETSRLYLEAVCLRGDRRVGHVLQDLHDSGTDLTQITKPQLTEALTAHGLDFDRHLRHMHQAVLPWTIVDQVDLAAQQRLATDLDERAACRA